MPFGRYPSRVKDFTKWSRTQVEKAELTGSATATTTRRGSRKRRRRRRKKHAKVSQTEG